MKKLLSLSLAIALFLSLCALPASAEKAADFAQDAYAYVQYIDANLPDRDCMGGVNYVDAQAYIKAELTAAGYKAEDIHEMEFTFEKKNRQTGEVTSVTAKNLYVTKPGTSGKQIIMGGHYDGTGTGDNASGFALTLSAAKAYLNVETYYDLTFVFFSAEEYGCHGSKAFANAMTEADIAKTQYMINADSLLCGDYCYIYGGVADKEAKTVNQIDAFQNAFLTASKMGLDVHTNPWTYQMPDPLSEDGIPAYPAPTTGDWSDHAAFHKIGIQYLYFEATNWGIGDFDGYEETALHGPMMNTDHDSLAIIEEYYPGRAQEHMTLFATLLNELLQQSELAW